MHVAIIGCRDPSHIVATYLKSINIEPDIYTTTECHNGCRYDDVSKFSPPVPVVVFLFYQTCIIGILQVINYIGLTVTATEGQTCSFLTFGNVHVFRWVYPLWTPTDLLKVDIFYIWATIITAWVKYIYSFFFTLLPTTMFESTSLQPENIVDRSLQTKIQTEGEFNTYDKIIQCCQHRFGDYALFTWTTKATNMHILRSLLSKYTITCLEQLVDNGSFQTYRAMVRTDPHLDIQHVTDWLYRHISICCPLDSIDSVVLLGGRIVGIESGSESKMLDCTQPSGTCTKDMYMATVVARLSHLKNKLA